MSFLKGLGGVLGTISPALGMITGKGLGGELGSLLPMVSPLAALLKGGGHGDGGGDKGGGQSGVPQVNPGHTPSAPAAPPPNAAASGLGRMIGVDPSRISSIAGSIGGGMNQIAAAGGAQGGYAPPPEMPAVNNHMQLLDPKILQALMTHFGGQRQ